MEKESANERMVEQLTAEGRNIFALSQQGKNHHHKHNSHHDLHQPIYDL